MELKPGSRWKSVRGPVQVVVVRPPTQMATLECGGHAMVRINAETLPMEPLAGAVTDVVLGKRYMDEISGMEILVSKAGPGPLTADARPLKIKEPKALPASD